MKDASVYLLVGEEKFFKDEFIKDTKNKLLDASNKELNFSLFSAADSVIENILLTANTLPFLSKKRVIVIKNIEKLNEKGRGTLIEFIKRPSNTTCLIIESDSAYISNDFLRTVSKYARLIKAERLSGYPLDSWIRKSVAALDKRISNDALELLKELAGDNLGLLSREIEKIVSFIGEKSDISAGDVEKVAGRSLKEDVFVLVDYIARKDLPAALSLARRLMVQGKKPHEIIGLVGWHMRKVISAKFSIEKKEKRDTVLSRLGLGRFYADRFKSLLDNFKTEELRDKLKLLFYADRDIKSTGLKAEYVLEILISRLCIT